MTIIHNGTDAVADDGAERSPRPRVVVLGRLVPQKRVEIALDAVAALRERVPGLHLDVVGTGWWEPQLREHVGRPRARGRRDVPRPRVRGGEAPAPGAAWVHAMPSLKEGWGLVVVEAGVHGTPTVAFRSAGGPADSIVDGETGLLVDAAEGQPEVEAFARTLESLLTDDARRERMSQAARRWVSRFRWEDCIEAWEQLLVREAGR